MVAQRWHSARPQLTLTMGTLNLSMCHLLALDKEEKRKRKDFYNNFCQ